MEIADILLSFSLYAMQCFIDGRADVFRRPTFKPLNSEVYVF